MDMIEKAKSSLSNFTGADMHALLSPICRLLVDPALTHAQKRARLADWASDARAVPDHPEQRLLDNGTVLQIDDLTRALKSLDSASVNPEHPSPAKRRDRYRFSAIRRLLRRPPGDDDDPPPSPATISPRPPLLSDGPKVAAYLLP